AANNGSALSRSFVNLFERACITSSLATRKERILKFYRSSFALCAQTNFMNSQRFRFCHILRKPRVLESGHSVGIGGYRCQESNLAHDRKKTENMAGHRPPQMHAGIQGFETFCLFRTNSQVFVAQRPRASGTGRSGPTSTIY